MRYVLNQSIKTEKGIRHADAQPMPLQSQSNLIIKSIIAEGWVTFIKLSVFYNCYNVHIGNPPFSYFFHSFVRLSPYQ